MRIAPLKKKTTFSLICLLLFHFLCLYSLQKNAPQDLSSWSSADELDTSGSLSPVSGRSTPSRRRSVTYTPPCPLCSTRSQSRSSGPCSDLCPRKPTSPLPSPHHPPLPPPPSILPYQRPYSPCHPRVSPPASHSLPLICSLFQACLLFFACDLSRERLPPDDGEPDFPAFSFVLFLN